MVSFRLSEVLKQKEIADPQKFLVDAGINRLTVKGLLSGHNTRIDFKTLEKVCKALDCTPNDLIKID